MSRAYDSDPDRFRLDDLDEQDGEIACKYCGEEGLHWEETDDGWRLFDYEGDQHVCREDRVVQDVADDFR